MPAASRTVAVSRYYRDSAEGGGAVCLRTCRVEGASDRGGAMPRLRKTNARKVVSCERRTGDPPEMFDLDPRNGDAQAERAQRCVGGQTIDGEADQLDPPLTMLFVDDDERRRDRIGGVLSEPGLHMLLADRNAASCVLSAARSVDRACVDPRGASFYRLAVLQQLAAVYPELEIVVLAGAGSIATAIEAMRSAPRDLHAPPAHVHQVLVALETYPSASRTTIDARRRAGSVSLDAVPLVTSLASRTSTRS